MASSGARLNRTVSQINSIFDKVDSISNAMQFRGTINIPSDFPTAALVKYGWVFVVNADVTDSDATKTNTGLSFKIGDEIAWTGTTWIALGPYQYSGYSGFSGISGYSGFSGTSGYSGFSGISGY